MIRLPARLDVIVLLASAAFTLTTIIWTIVSPETLAALLGV